MKKRPNLLLLFTDMQRADTIGALGNPIIKTPALDRLAREGTAFTSAYTPSPVCVSARCSLHYGLMPGRTGCSENTPMMADNGRSYPALLTSAGYRTHAIGKCHFTPDAYALRGFQTRETQEEGVSRSDYQTFLLERGFDAYEPMGPRGEMYYLPQPSHLPQSVHPTQWVGDRACRFIEEASGEKPWCLFTSFIHPHPPFTPPRPWHKLYRGPLMPMPRRAPDQGALLTSINRIQNRYKYRDQGIDLNLLRCIKAYYYACISFVDYQVGRILGALEARGALDETLVVFASDHGEFLGDFDCFGKRSMHDPSARIPLLARSPARFPAGARCETPASLVDILPTFLAAAEVPAPASNDGRPAIDGVDLADLASGARDRAGVGSQWSSGPNGQYLWVTRRWKYFYSAADRKEFLFDRVADPLELRNMAGLSLVSKEKIALRGALLNSLKKDGVVDAYTEENGQLSWKRHPAVDDGLQSWEVGELFRQTELSDDPDAFLLFQDAPKADMPKAEGIGPYQA